MKSITETIVLPEKPENIWRVLADVENFKTWIPLVVDLKILSKEEVGLGTTWHITKETDIGFQEIDQEINMFQKNKQISWHDIRSFLDQRAMTQITDMNTVFTLHSVAGGTMVELSATWEPVGMAGRMFSSVYFKRYTQKRLRQTLNNLRAVV
ncbi:SRPBCC family protein [Patescibacteria group bacterium]